MGQTRPLFLFSFFSQFKGKYKTKLTIKDKSIDGVLGTWTQGGMLEGADEIHWAMAAPLQSFINKTTEISLKGSHPKVVCWPVGTSFYLGTEVL